GFVSAGTTIDAEPGSVVFSASCTTDGSLLVTVKGVAPALPAAKATYPRRSFAPAIGWRVIRLLVMRAANPSEVPWREGCVGPATLRSGEVVSPPSHTVGPPGAKRPRMRSLPDPPK